MSSPPRGGIDADNVWIYHETQQSALCGQHALNNLVQRGHFFTTAKLAAMAHQLDQLELEYMAQNTEGGRQSKDYLQRIAEGSGNVDAAGNFSIQVLKAALQNEFDVSLPHLLSEQQQSQSEDITQCQGFLCHKNDHWFAIRQIGARFWNLNSQLDKPVVISHFQLAKRMEDWRSDGYTVFVIKDGLPEGGQQVEAATEHQYWHRMSDLLSGKSTSSGGKAGSGDPWFNVGSGMRLDGGGGGGNGASGMAIAGLTEEEQLQLAMQQSLEPSAPAPISNTARVVSDLPVPPEPPAGAPGTARISFRLPDKRDKRRFAGTDSVAVLYAYCQQSTGTAVELKYGYPPKDLAPLMAQTIGEAGLDGENLTGRYV